MRAFWLTAYVFVAVMIGTTLPTPLYPGYEARFGFGPFTVTVVFAAYAVGVLAALIGFGHASDQVGRKPLLIAALVLSALSSTGFVVVSALDSGGLPLLLVSRVLSGLSAGAVTGTATAMLADLAGPDRALRASLVSAVANIGGLGLGPITAGLLARHVALPLRTSFLVHLGLLAVAALALRTVPDPVRDRAPLRTVRPQRLAVPAPSRAVLVQAGTAGFAGFAVLGLFTSVSPAVLGLLGHRNPALTGLVVFLVFAASASGQLLSARLPSRTALLTGTAVLVVGLGLVGVAVGQRSLALLVTSGVIAGAGQGLSFRAALAAVTASSPPAERGTVASSFFAVCYVGISLPVLGIGAGTHQWGLVHTAEVFAAVMAVLAAVALVSLARTLRPTPA